MHGGTQIPTVNEISVDGLSPHARGNLGGQQNPRMYYGSIPACTGEPVAMRKRMQLLRVYPRMHGGTTKALLVLGVTLGLSPHARGNHSFKYTTLACSGSIPACTGEPDNRVSCTFPHKVYPRMHGGTLWVRHAASSDHGLSPHARGNQPVLQFSDEMVRSIPACTGEPPA